jgi:predicted transcriptional regulator
VAEGPKEQPKEPLVPAVSIKKSVQPDYIVCLEDGKKFQSLKRHLRKFDMTPDQYRAKWDLPRDYPMVAPNYASRRSELAKAIGLGQARKGKPSKKKAAALEVGAYAPRCLTGEEFPRLRFSASM